MPATDTNYQARVSVMCQGRWLSVVPAQPKQSEKTHAVASPAAEAQLLMQEHLAAQTSSAHSHILCLAAAHISTTSNTHHTHDSQQLKRGGQGKYFGSLKACCVTAGRCRQGTLAIKAGIVLRVRRLSLALRHTTHSNSCPASIMLLLLPLLLAPACT